MSSPSLATPNYVNPESIAHRVIVVSILGAVITIPICSMRIYTKRTILKSFGWDDCKSLTVAPLDEVRCADWALDAIILATVRLRYGLIVCPADRSTVLSFWIFHIDLLS